MRMDITESAEALVKKRGRQEWLAGGVAVSNQFLLAAIQKYWLHQYIGSGALFGGQALLLGLGLLFCSCQKERTQKKLEAHLGKSFKDDIRSELIRLKTLSNISAWAEFRNRSRWELGGIYIYSSILGAVGSAFVF